MQIVKAERIEIHHHDKTTENVLVRIRTFPTNSNGVILLYFLNYSNKKYNNRYDQIKLFLPGNIINVFVVDQLL